MQVSDINLLETLCDGFGAKVCRASPGMSESSSSVSKARKSRSAKILKASRTKSNENIKQKDPQVRRCGAHALLTVLQ